MASSREVEQSVLGAVLKCADEAWAQVDPLGLRPRHFSDAGYAEIYASVLAVRERGLAVDVVTVLAEIQDRGLSGEKFTYSYLEALALSVPSASNARSYAEILLEQDKRRQVETIGRALQTVAASGATSGVQLDERIRELLKVLQETTTERESASPGFPVEWASSLGDTAEVPQQLIEGLLTVGGLSSVNGQPNAGKSYIASHAALCISAGLDFLGRRTQKAPCLYVAAEGAASVRARWQAYRKHFGQEFGPLALVAQSINMLDPSEDVDALIGTAAVMRASSGIPLGLIVIDTVARVMVGGDENTAVDMGRLIGAADRLRETTGAHVMLIHHMGKDASKGARGHSSLRAALDTEIEVTVDEATKTHYAKVTKQRDLASKGEVFGCKFIPVELGVDQWGNPITACAVEQSDVGIGKPTPRKMTAAQQAVMGFLAGRSEGCKKAVIVSALEPQGIGRATVYRAINELLMAGLVMEAAGRLYAPKAA